MMHPEQVIISWDQWEEYVKLKMTPIERESVLAGDIASKIRLVMEKPNTNPLLTVEDLVVMLENWNKA